MLLAVIARAIPAEASPRARKRGNRALLSEEQSIQRASENSTKRVASAPGETGTAESSAEEAAAASNTMHVDIRGTKYYGGMETLYHPLLATQVCHVFNACMRPDGTLLLPSWMRRHDVTLARACGIKDALFLLSDTNPPPGGPLLPFDLFGIQMPRHHMPHFFMDFLQNAIALDTVYGDHELQRACFTRAGKNCEAMPEVNAATLKPAVFLDPRAGEVQEKDSWVRQIVRLASVSAAAGKTKHLFWSSVFRNVQEKNMKCFRSAYISHAPSTRLQVKPGLFDKLHMFTDNGIEKKSSRVQRSLDDKCLLNVTFINRKPVENHPDRLIGRYIPNIPAIRDQLHRMAAEAGDLTLYVDAFRLEGRAVRWQMNAMQKTNILVGGHSSMLTNMIFMRSWSSVLELQPFSYYPDVYERLATRVSNLRYDSVVAHPDEVAFDACIAHFYPPGADQYQDAMDVQKRFHKAIENYEKSEKNTHSITLHNLDAKLANVRVCAEMQNLDTNPTRLAESIFTLARSACKRKG